MMGDEMHSRVAPKGRRAWHDGERLMHRHVGVAARMDEVGPRAIRDYLTEQHRLFFPLLPFVVLGAVDAGGDVWATLRAGRPGFLSAPDPTHLTVALAADPADPAEGGLGDGQSVGMLGIELHTRRRNRLNGVIHRDRPESFSVAVEQSFGNCPRYIMPRELVFARAPDASSPVEPVALSRLEGAAADLVRQADTFFVASYITDDDGRHRIDVSHRGGKAGFVGIDADGALTIPDYPGNLFFNTLGNFLLNPKAGLAFVNFVTGDLLQMTGDTVVLLDSPEIAAFSSAERLWQFKPRRLIYRPSAVPLRLTSP